MKVRNLLIEYKYVKTMSPVTRSYDYFLRSITDKINQINNRKLELHINPFYYLGAGNSKYVWQIVFDFDKNAYTKVRRFFDRLTNPEKKIFNVENSGTGYHVVCKYAFYPIPDRDFIAKLRKSVQLLFGDIIDDVTSSVRYLPIRRTPSKVKPKTSKDTRLVLSFSYKEFYSKSRTEIDLIALKFKFKNKKQLYDYLKTKTLPVDILHYSEFDTINQIFVKAKKLKI